MKYVRNVIYIQLAFGGHVLISACIQLTAEVILLLTQLIIRLTRDIKTDF